MLASYIASLAAYVRRIADNPKTSVPGICSLCAGIGQIVHHPAVLLDPNAAAIPVALLVTGIGLLNSADSK